MEGYISPSLFVRLGVLVIRVPPQSLQLQIALPPLPPAVCPVKSAHDVSLSQLWVEIHRINRFVRETHAWDCLHAVRLVHTLVRPIPPQAMEKQGTYRYMQDPHGRTCAHFHAHARARRRACMRVCKQTRRFHSTSSTRTHLFMGLCVCLQICLSLSRLSPCLPQSLPICLCFTSLAELVSRSRMDVSSHVITVR